MYTYLLQFFMTLKRDNEVDYVIPSDDRVSLCDERPLAQLMRGMLVATVQDTSCPIEKACRGLFVKKKKKKILASRIFYRVYIIFTFFSSVFLFYPGRVLYLE